MGNFIISFLYAPIILLSLRYFDIKSVSFTLILFSLAWLSIFFIKRGSKGRPYFPLLYLVMGGCGLAIGDFHVLKATPLLIAVIFTAMIILSSLTKDPFILKMAKRFSRHTIDAREEAYIRQSTKLWIAASLVNVALHVVVLLHPDVYYWGIYTTVGWYAVFIVAGAVQYLHRRYVFLKAPHA